MSTTIQDLTPVIQFSRLDLDLIIRMIRLRNMPRVSRKILHPTVKAKIHELLLDCISRCRDQKTTARFIDDLLTETEKVMIAKRIAVALMILKGHPSIKIEETLKVSGQTIWLVRAWLTAKGEGYRQLLKEVIERDERQEKEHEQVLWEARETTPRWGSNWRSAKRREWQRVRDTKVPF